MGPQELILFSFICSHVSLNEPCLKTTKAMFTWDRFQTDRIALLFTRVRFGTGPERIQNWTDYFAGPVLDPFRTGSRTVPC